MSTRCQIGFYEPDNDNLLKPNALIYRHSDGYPDGEHGVIAALVPFLTKFHKRRGLQDAEYAAAWTLHHLISLSMLQQKEYYDKNPKYAPEDGISCLGFGICDDFHGDIAYYYTVKNNKLTVYSVNDETPDYHPNHFVYKKEVVIE